MGLHFNAFSLNLLWPLWSGVSAVSPLALVFNASQPLNGTTTVTANSRMLTLTSTNGGNTVFISTCCGVFLLVIFDR